MRQILLKYSVIGPRVGFSTLLGFIFACIKTYQKKKKITGMEKCLVNSSMYIISFLEQICSVLKLQRMDHIG